LDLFLKDKDMSQLDPADDDNEVTVFGNDNDSIYDSGIDTLPTLPISDDDDTIVNEPSMSGSVSDRGSSNANTVIDKPYVSNSEMDVRSDEPEWNNDEQKLLDKVWDDINHNIDDADKDNPIIFSILGHRVSQGILELRCVDDYGQGWYPVKLVKTDEPEVVAKYIRANPLFFSARFKCLLSWAKQVRDAMYLTILRI